MAIIGKNCDRMKIGTVSITVLIFLLLFISGCIDQENADNEDEEYPSPEEVQLFFNHTCFFTTRNGKFLEVGGEPKGSNITWTLDGEIIGYGKIFQYMPRESDYKLLRVDVKWGSFEKNHSRWIMIQQRDSRGGFETSSNGTMGSETNPHGYSLNIKPAITIPSLMLNVSASQINGTMRYWIKLQEEDTYDYFETVVDVEANLTMGNYSRSFFFDKLFFIERDDHEPYLLSFLFTIESNNGSYSKIVTEHWLDY